MTKLYECSCCGRRAHKPFTKHKCRDSIKTGMPAYITYGCACEDGLGVDWYDPE